MTLSNSSKAFMLSIGMLLLVLLGCCILDPSDNDDALVEIREVFDYTVEIGDRTVFRISGINGPMDIVGKTDYPSVEIWGEKIVRSHSLADAEAYLEYLEVVVSSDENEVRVRTEQPGNTEGRDCEVVYHVKVPESWQVFAENTNGEIGIDSLKSTAYVNGTNGDIVLKNIVGQVNAGLINGDVLLMNFRGSVVAGVTNGRIQGEVTLPLDGLCTLGVVNGSIDLDIPVSTSAEFMATVSYGHIRITGLVLKDQVTTERSTSGRLGNGQGVITLQVVNGNIDVHGT
jgi:hypothetical protein